ncbi:MAG TPA: hypothetical protein PKD72_10035, partial [Gemmatales bacterium]|nr:hypothetical protein [Gemmatales bacterium]
ACFHSATAFPMFPVLGPASGITFVSKTSGKFSGLNLCKCILFIHLRMKLMYLAFQLQKTAKISETYGDLQHHSYLPALLILSVVW